MEFSLSSDQEILRDSVRSFAENEIKPVAQVLDKKEEFSSHNICSRYILQEQVHLSSIKIL